MDSFRSRMLDRIRNAENSRRLMIDGDKHRRLALASQNFRLFGGIPAFVILSVNKMPVSDCDCFTIYDSLYAFARDGLKVARIREFDPVLGRSLGDRCGQW